MTMKTYTTILSILFLSLSSLCWCQPPGGEMGPLKEEAKKKIKALHKGFINDRLELTETEAEKFWPVYEEFKKKEKDIMKEAHPRKKKPYSDMTEEEARTLLEKRLESEEKIIQLRKEYVSRFLEILPAKKVILLHRAERDFKKEVLRRMKDKKDKIKEQRGDRPPREGRGRF